ncbi:hybrid sensor histidine kinase/response regulator transcription factor [Terrimonas pollutisoli]|uniref:hybrid sensor histidine kinase/response regulator transcription factor n=1 Tax=Terrimonas pollutisoli TaxID=3034147 RepID=UPI0023EA91AB|nr:hybrid sensor histidine kinase/response regulator transcription factor [Terrimonas sp. H1YJ31]
MCLPALCRYLTVVVSVLFSCQLKSQDVQVKYLGIENGLSNNVVNSIFQDHNGFMWFGTYDGLNRYDGYSFKTYRNVVGDSTSLSSNNINVIDEDAGHRLWVGGQKEVNIFNPVTSTFSTPSYSFYKGKTTQRLNDNVIALSVTDAGKTLAGTQHNGLFYFSDANVGRQIPLKWKGKDVLNYYVSAINYDKRKGVAYVFVQDYGLYEFNFKDGSLRLKSDVLRYANCLKAIGNEKLWLGNDWGLYLFDEITNRFSESYVSYRGPVVSLCEDKKGVLWIATDGAGVWLLEHGETKAKPLQPANDDGKSLINSNSVYAVCEDKEERKWIGTLRGGINIVEPASPFKKIVYQPGDNNASVKNFIFSFCEDEPGKIWIGTDGAGLRYWNRSTNTYQTFEHDEKNPGSISSNFITSIIKDKQNNVWFSTWFDGINRYNRATKSFERFKCFNSKTKGVNSNIWRLVVDSKDRLWACAVRSGGLYQFDYRLKQFVEFDNSLSELQALAEDRSGTLWGGDYSALIKIDTLTKKHTYYKVGYPIRCIYEDKKNNFWVGTQEGGLMLFDKKTGRFERYTTNDGLSNNTVLRMLEDEQGNIWLSTYNGLSKFNAQKKEWQNFYQSDGLQSNQFSFNAALALQSGEFIFGGIKGFNIFYPGNVYSKSVSPEIFLSGLRVNNSPIAKNEAFVKERELEKIRRIVIPYDEALLTLDYLGLDYSDVSNINYAYQLKGWDKHWNNVGNSRTANYSNLQEGDYIFEVKVSNKRGAWSEPYDLLHITVLPPWYRTWWAYCIYFLVVAGVLYFYTLYKSRQARLKYQIQLANVEVQKERELNEKKIAFFTNVSHEFRTPLSLIINPIKDLLHKKDSKAETRELRIVYRNARRLLRLVDQLLLFKKAEQEIGRLNLSNQNIYALCREVFFCFSEQARSRKISYELRCDVKDIMIEADREKIEIALFNILSNAFKFTPDEGSIIFTIEEDNEKVKISVSDTGQGIPAEEGQKLFERFTQLKSANNKAGFGIGLYLVRNFVEAHGGSVSFNSGEGRGTTFHISLNKLHVNEVVADNVTAVMETRKIDQKIDFSNAEIPSTAKPVSSLLNEMSEDPAEQEESQTNSVVIQELATEKQTLLIIDDDQEIRHYLVSILNDQYKILQADDGVKGLKLAKEHLPDLIISDIVMGGLDGLDLCKTIKEDSSLNHIPVILLTGSSSDEMQLKGMNKGADDFIKKPFDKDILMARVSSILKRRNILQSYFYNEVTLGSAKFKVSVEYKEFIENCMRIIEEHLLDDDFSIKVLATEMGMSHSNLYKKIRAVSGQSLNSFIRFVRLKKAAELMISTEMNVNETATMVGFQSIKYFRAQFYNLFGLNPSDYIKKFRKPFHNNQTLDHSVRK